MSEVKRALLLSTGDRYFALVANFITVAVVSRILTPGEIGVSVVGMAIVGIVMSVREFASANFLIQRRDLTRENVRSAFTVMLILTAAITLTLTATAPIIATVMEDDRLTPYLRIIALSLLLDVPSIPILALMRRDLSFGRVAAASIAGAATAATVTVVLAFAGFSYMSFAWAWLSSVIVTGILALSLSRQFWIFRPCLADWREMMTFGGYHGCVNLLHRLYESMPYLVLGRMLSTGAAALFNRSIMLCQLPDKIVLGGAMSVVLPAFSVEARNGRGLRGHYLKALEIITALQWPALATLAVLAYPAVNLLFGDQWRDVTPLVRIMAVASLWSFCFELNYPVLVSMGAVRDVFLRAAFVFPISAAIIAIAAFISLNAVAWSMMIVMPFQAYVSLRFVRRHIAIRWRDVVASTWRSGVVALATVLAPMAMALSVSPRFELSVAEGLVAGVLAACGWLAGLYLTRHPLLAEITSTFPVFRRPFAAKA